VHIVVRDKTATYSWDRYRRDLRLRCWADFSEAVAFEIGERQRAVSSCYLLRRRRVRAECRFDPVTTVP
jgi:hypothetical protein